MEREPIDFNCMPCLYWSEQAKITHLQRRILLYSVMYYRMNVSVVSDYDYDAMCFQLARMQKEHPDAAKKSMYWHAFYDFEGYTGYHLTYRLDDKELIYLTDLAQLVYSYWLENTEPEERELILKGAMHAPKAKPKRYL